MRLAAFFIYALNLILVVVKGIYSGVFEESIFLIAFIITIALCIAAFIFKKICEDEYLRSHFWYQFRTILVLLVFGIVVEIISSFMPTADAASTFNDTRALSLSAYLIYMTGIFGVLSIVVGIWFIYRNVKGIIYLNKHKEL
ncbi:MAG: hypothetical protein LBT96_03805 [Campylobacteraceae bacterium]|jgi:uncharacterized membrane protein|nr:hypothetical protein [Campylobacteraceae bacterium]